MPRQLTLKEDLGRGERTPSGSFHRPSWLLHVLSNTAPPPAEDPGVGLAFWLASGVSQPKTEVRSRFLSLWAPRVRASGEGTEPSFANTLPHVQWICCFLGGCIQRRPFRGGVTIRRVAPNCVRQHGIKLPLPQKDQFHSCAPSGTLWVTFPADASRILRLWNRRFPAPEKPLLLVGSPGASDRNHTGPLHPASFQAAPLATSTPPAPRATA